jgi:pheromone shutdown-related protein TraB
VSSERIVLGEREIVLVGTAHVSRSSAEEVAEVIRAEGPDRVCVELDEGRLRTMSEGQSLKEIDVYRVLREGKGLFMLATLVLGSFQRRLGMDLGVEQGAEMRAAVATASELGIPYSVCDRDIQVTLRRAWARSSLWGRSKMLAAMLSSVVTREKLTEEEIERLKERNALEEMMDELAGYLPAAKEVLIDERDRYIAARIAGAPGRRIVAVVGAGHLAGIRAQIAAFGVAGVVADVSGLDEMPRKSAAARILPWAIPAVIVALLAVGFVRAGAGVTVPMILRWFLVSGSLTAAGTLLALGHPLTMIAGFIAAPFTAIHPLVGVGFVTGIVEAAVRRPRVSDFASLAEDTVTVRGFYRNRFTRILLVFFLSSVGNSVGTFIAIPYLSRLLWS